MEAKISMVAEFLQGCSAELSPYRAAETLHYVLTIGSIPVYPGGAHEAHQIRPDCSPILDLPFLPKIVAASKNCRLTQIWDRYR
jgi:hypothetical protein